MRESRCFELQPGLPADGPAAAIGHNEPPVTFTPAEREAIHPWGPGGEWIPQGEVAQAHPALAESMR